MYVVDFKKNSLIDSNLRSFLPKNQQTAKNKEKEPSSKARDLKNLYQASCAF